MLLKYSVLVSIVVKDYFEARLKLRLKKKSLDAMVSSGILRFT